MPDDLTSIAAWVGAFGALLSVVNFFVSRRDRASDQDRDRRLDEAELLGRLTAVMSRIVTIQHYPAENDETRAAFADLHRDCEKAIDGLGVENPSPEAVDVARRTVSMAEGLCNAVLERVKLR